ncbi:MAG: S-layer homology domain-containing protein [Eubacteriales bacterium]|nr:S-layer homology domain-containing protein [Eubacteriales bacterium]
MNTKSKICAGVMSALVAFGATGLNGFAYYSQQGNDGLYISGNTTCRESGQILGIDLWTPDKGFADLAKESERDKYTDILAYRYQVKTSEDGFYEDSIKLKSTAKSGVYKLRVSCECGESIIEEDVVYSNPTENAAALAKLAAAKDSAEVISICNEYKYALGFVSDFKLNSDGAQILYSWVKSGEFSLSDPDIKIKAIDEYNRAVTIAAISAGNISNLFDYDKQLSLDKSRIAGFYKENFVTEGFKTTITSALKNKTYTSKDVFIDALYENFVLQTVKNSDGYINIVNVVNEFKTDIGLSTGITKSQALKVMNNSYADYSALKSALAEGGNGSGGGSGSGSGSSLGTSFGEGYTDSGVVEPMNTNIFDDLDSVEWAKSAIVELAQLGIINGKTVNTFCPNDNITREEFIKLVVMAFVPEAKRVPADVVFDDVDDGEWYADYVKIAYGLNIVKGVGDNRFGTGETITRQDAAVMVYNTAVMLEMMSKAEDTDIVFEDEASMADYAKDAIYTMAENGIINGVDGVNFAPCDYLTRAEAAKIIYGVYTIEY